MSEQTTSAAAPAERPRYRWYGEWSWEKYIPGVAGIAVLVYAVIEASSVGGFITSEAFQTSLLLFIGAYLSEMRYKLFPDLRNN